MNLKDNLKKIRKDNNLSQEDLAEKLGVSRQAVSKWEQGIAYPEMDKVLQICKMFNLNIDEILNQNIDEVERNKQSKSNINKYIDDFLDYVTKTIKMFSSMKTKDRIKCIFEQFILIFALLICSFIIGEVLESVYGSIFGFLGENLYFGLLGFLKGIFSLVFFILSVIILFHVFKVRYLDYYVIVEEEKEVKETEEVKEEYIKEDKEKIIIRDPKHSEYGFIKGIFKCLLFVVKFFLFFCGISICFSLIGVVILFVLSFIFIKTGLLFIGGLLGCISLIALHILVLYLIYSIITNLKIKKLLFFISFMFFFILGGVSCGLIITSIKDFKFISNPNSKYLTTETEEIQMSKDLIIEDGYFDISYKESNNKNIVIEYRHSSYCEFEHSKNDNIIRFNYYCDGKSAVKKIVKDLENKIIISPRIVKITIYTTKENIKVLKDNLNKYYQDNTNKELYELRNEVDKLNNELSTKERQLQYYKDLYGE